MIDLLGFLPEPAFFCFVGELVEAAVLPAQERTAEGCALKKKYIYLFIYLFGTRKADRFTDVVKECRWYKCFGTYFLKEQVV